MDSLSCLLEAHRTGGRQRIGDFTLLLAVVFLHKTHELHVFCVQKIYFINNFKHSIYVFCAELCFHSARTKQIGVVVTC